MGEFPSGQRGQTVNLLLIASVVRIHLPPPILFHRNQFHMGEFPSGQRGQTVNLLLIASVVRIHLPPPNPHRFRCGFLRCVGNFLFGFTPAASGEDAAGGFLFCSTVNVKPLLNNVKSQKRRAVLEDAGMYRMNRQASFSCRLPLKMQITVQSCVVATTISKAVILSLRLPIRISIILTKKRFHCKFLPILQNICLNLVLQ